MIALNRRFAAFFLRAFAFLLLQIPMAFWVYQRGEFPKSDHYLSTWSDKTQRLISANGPRLILVGGSNLAFGIDSQMLKDATGFEPVNLGLHAALGLEYQLKQVKQYARQGDVVVLCPEYETYMYRLLPYNETLVDDLLEQAPAAAGVFRRDSWSQRKRFLDVGALVAASGWVQRAFDPPSFQPQAEPYHRGGFNRYGDMVDHLSKEPSRFEIGKIRPIEKVDIVYSISVLNQFVADCEAQGARVVYTFPVMPKERWVKSRQLLEDLSNSLDRRLNAELLGTPSHFVYDSHEFFDTEYHLQKRSVGLRSNTLANLLRQSEALSISAGKTRLVSESQKRLH
jgi:hypothetical protein